MKKSLLAGILSAVYVAANCAIAQSVYAAEESGDSDTLEPVVVTAQRRSESLLTIPISITALTADDLSKSRINSTTDLVGYIPGLQAATNYGEENPTFSLRGISSYDYSLTTSSPVAVYVDEVYRSGAPFLSTQLYDLDRVEVLRGPQGTLYGKNATGGAIDFVTRAPSFDTNGYLGVSTGNYNLFETNGAYQTKINDEVAFRFAFTTSRERGYIGDILPGASAYGSHKHYGARLSILFKPSDSLQAILRIATSQVGPNVLPDTIAHAPTGVGSSTGVGVGGGLYATYHALYPLSNPHVDYIPTTGPYQTAAGQQSRTDSAAHDVTLTLTWGLLKNLNLVSVSSYNRGFFSSLEDGDGSPLAVISDYSGAYGDAFAEDLRLMSASGGLFDYIAGLYFSRDRMATSNFNEYYLDIDFNGDGKLNYQDCLSAINQGLYPYGCGTQNSFRQERKSRAIYADGSVALSDHLRVRAGVRYSSDTLDVSQYNAYYYGNDGTPLGNNIPGGNVPIDAELAPQSASWNRPTGRFGLEYTLPDSTLLYAMLSHGYRSGAVNAQAFNFPTEVTIVNPETLDAAEVGVKGDFLGHILRLTADVFYYQYKNQQAQNINPATFATTLINLDRSRVRGGELEIKVRPIPKITASVGISALDTRVQSAMASGVNLAGLQLSNAPKFSGNAALDWTARTIEPGQLIFHADTRYIGRQFQDIFDTPYIETRPYTVTGLRSRFDFADLPLSISLWTENVFNKYYLTDTVDTTPFGYIYQHPGPPRTFGADMSYRF